MPRRSTVLKPPKPKSETFTWRHVTCQVKISPNYLGDTTMLELRVISPKGCPTPLTDTGYRCEFADPQDIAAAGGPVAYLSAKMDAEVASKKYKEADYRWRQGDLFSKIPKRARVQKSRD